MSFMKILILFSLFSCASVEKKEESIAYKNRDIDSGYLTEKEKADALELRIRLEDMTPQDRALYQTGMLA